MGIGVVMHDFYVFYIVKVCYLFDYFSMKIILTAGNGYGFLISIVINRIGWANYRLTIIYCMLGSYQATTLPNRKQRSGGKIGKQTLQFF